MAVALSPFSSLYAQSSVGEQGENTVNESFTCDSFYTPNDIQITVQPSIETTVPGTPVTYTGTIQNNSNHIIRDVAVYAHVYFEAETGTVLADEFEVIDKIFLKPTENRTIEFEWNVPLSAPNGEYYAEISALASDAFYYEQSKVSAESEEKDVNFVVTSGNENLLILDQSSISLNGDVIESTENQVTISDSQENNLTIDITNSTNQTLTLPLEWKQYSWSGLSSGSLQNTSTQAITLEPNQTERYTYTLKPTREPQGVVIVSLNHEGFSTSIRTPFIRDSIVSSKIIYAGIDNIPVASGEQVTYSACVAAYNGQPENTEVRISIKDESGTVLSESTQPLIESGEFAFEGMFTANTNINTASLAMAIIEEGVIKEEISLTYSCEDFDESLCINSENNEESFFDQVVKNKIWFIGGAMILLLLLLLIWLVHQRQKPISLIK